MTSKIVKKSIESIITKKAYKVVRLNKENNQYKVVSSISDVIKVQNSMFRRLETNRQIRILQAIEDRSLRINNKIILLESARERRQNLILDVYYEYHGKSFNTDNEYVNFLLIDKKNTIYSMINNQLYLISRDKYSYYNADDIYSYIWERYLLNNSIINLQYFYSCIKWIIKDSIKTLVQRDRKFKACSYNDFVDNEDNANYVSDFNMSYTFNYDIITKIDMENLFDKDELTVYRLHYEYDYTIRKINQILNKRCDRIYNRVKAKIAEYVMNN